MGIRSHLLVATALLLGSALTVRAAAPPVPVPIPQAQQRQILIATESGTFKDRLVSALVDRVRERKLEVKVIDIGGLADISSTAWTAIVIVHNWEFGEPPAAVREFLARTADPTGIIDVTTSSSGQEKPAGIDVVTSASVVDEIPTMVATIDSKIAALMRAK